jgi:glycosyltransferase involved in cell wall biosynthesis
MSVVLVDWLGRGGIAQCTDAWGKVAAENGHQVTVVTRRGRELAEHWPDAATPSESVSALWTHARLVRLATELVQEQQPDTVVLANYLVPSVEVAVVRAARRAGARCIVVVHDHRAHQVGESMRVGLGALLRRADLVVTHSRFVAEQIEAVAGHTPVVCWPLPLPGLMLQEICAGDPPWLRCMGGRPEVGRSPSFFETSVLPTRASALPVAVHFGILRRRYKGTDTVAALASAGLPGWRFAFLGPGAPQVQGPQVYCDNRFLPSPELVTAVRASAVTLLPYQNATQSGAVVLAQVVGSVVVASKVGGLPEQVDDGRSGILLPVGAGPSAWREVLEDLSDDGRRRALADVAGQTVAARHQCFTDYVRGVLASRTAQPGPRTAQPGPRTAQPGHTDGRGDAYAERPEQGSVAATALAPAAGRP